MCLGHVQQLKHLPMACWLLKRKFLRSQSGSKVVLLKLVQTCSSKIPFSSLGLCNFIVLIYQIQSGPSITQLILIHWLFKVLELLENNDSCMNQGWFGGPPHLPMSLWFEKRWSWPGHAISLITITKSNLLHSTQPPQTKPQETQPNE